MVDTLLFEPLLWHDVVDYPDLGAACLQGALQESGIRSKLVCTQLAYIEKLFLDCGPEIERLYQSLPETEKPSYPALSGLKAPFSDSFSALFRDYYSHSWAHYLNPQLTVTFQQVFLESNRLQWACSGAVEAFPILRFFRETVAENPSRILCVSLYEYSPVNRRILKTLRESTTSPIVLGGAFTGHLTDREIDAIATERLVDYLIVGPGEIALPHLVRHLRGERPDLPPNVVDTSHPFPEKGGLVRKPLAHLDQIPAPDFSQSCVDRYPCPAPILPLLTGRGCTWRKCTFCSHHSSYFGEYHTVSVKRTVDTILHLNKSFGCRHFVLHDDEIACQRLVNIGRMLKEKGVDVQLSAYARADAAFLKEGVLEELSQLGIRCLNWGIESGSQRMLDDIRKGIRADQARTILEGAARAGIVNTCWMMINLPGETDEDFDHSVRFMLDTAPSVALWLVSPFRLQYDSPLFEMQGDGSEKELFRTSVEPDSASLTRERRLAARIDALFSAGLLSNGLLPARITLSGSQRARLLPFVYASSAMDPRDRKEGGPFQIVPTDGKLIRLGKKLFLSGKKEKVELDTREYDLIARGMAGPLDEALLDERQASFLGRLSDRGLIRILKCTYNDGIRH